MVARFGLRPHDERRRVRLLEPRHGRGRWDRLARRGRRDECAQCRRGRPNDDGDFQLGDEQRDDFQLGDEQRHDR
jgi:hypothetical protein